jgi:hypothetical protein
VAGGGAVSGAEHGQARGIVIRYSPLAVV